MFVSKQYRYVDVNLFVHAWKTILFLFCNSRCSIKRKRISVICYIYALVRLVWQFLYIPDQNIMKSSRKYLQQTLNQSQAKLNFFKTENCSQNSVALPNGTCACTLVHLHCFSFKTRIKALTPNDSTSSFCELLFSRKKIMVTSLFYISLYAN